MERVYFKTAGYDDPALKEKVSALLTAAAADAVGAGARVLIKPNLLTAARPEQAVQTHPLPGKSGRPRPLGILAAGRDAASVDAAICRFLALDPDRLPTHRAARELGILRGEPEVAGNVGRVSDFRFPEQGAVLFGPQVIQKFSRRAVIQKPVVDPGRCSVCGECRRICPAGAISEDGGNLRYDYDRCIRCYCCVEVCPHGALRVKTPSLGRVLHRLGILD